MRVGLNGSHTVLKINVKCSPACCIMLQSYSQLDCEPQDPIDVRVHVRRKNVYSTPESYGEKRQQ